jgi:phosphopantothenoylcysteine decarboxylase/phosphopantothenate--cysteine ligase
MAADFPFASPRRILLGVSGGIAAYKAAELVRQFVKAGVEVQVVATAAAQHFVGAATFQALSGRPLRDSLWDAQAEAAMGHIELARWADAIVLAPASADLLARLAHGFADDLLTTLCLASDRPWFAAPAMNRLMWAHPATQANIETLKARGCAVIGPGAGEQACGEIGDGRMSEPHEIAAQVFAALQGGAWPVAAGVLPGVRAVVTAGPTREPLDPVRFITNRSSGKQGYAIAAALAAQGAAVTLVSGPVALAAPAGVHRIDVETAEEMLTATLAAMEGAELLVGAAAVADYRAAAPAPQKIKKSGESLQLSLVRNPDILATARQRFPGAFLCGFAAETENLATHARAKLAAKRLDLIAANEVGGSRGFDVDDNQLHLFWADGEQCIGPASKAEIARELVQCIARRFAARRAA